MKRKLLLLLAFSVLATMIVNPYRGQALTQMQKIEQELKNLKRDMEKAKNSQKAADNKVQTLNGQKAATQDDLNKINSEIEQLQQEMKDTRAKKKAAEEKVRIIAQELESAIGKRDYRFELKDERVRDAYMAGPTTLLDVLMGSEDLGDFLTRLDYVEVIIHQDNEIAEQALEYEQQVESKKAQVDHELAEIKALYAKEQSQDADLKAKKQHKFEVMANISEQIVEYAEISEEEEAQLKKFAKKMAELEAKKKALKTYYKGGRLAVPLRASYTLASKFGYRTHPIYKTKRLHTGIDMAAPKGTPIYAAESGRVITARSMSGYGNCVIIAHGGGLQTLYGHIMSGGILVKEGQEVERGDLIGKVGSTGDSTGNHLHFEVRNNFEPVDPAPYLK